MNINPSALYIIRKNPPLIFIQSLFIHYVEYQRIETKRGLYKWPL